MSELFVTRSIAQTIESLIETGFLPEGFDMSNPDPEFPYSGQLFDVTSSSGRLIKKIERIPLYKIQQDETIPPGKYVLYIPQRKNSEFSIEIDVADMKSHIKKEQPGALIFNTQEQIELITLRLEKNFTANQLMEKTQTIAELKEQLKEEREKVTRLAQEIPKQDSNLQMFGLMKEISLNNSTVFAGNASVKALMDQYNKGVTDEAQRNLVTIKGLQEKIDDLEDEVQDLETDLEKLKTDYTELKEDHRELELTFEGKVPVKDDGVMGQIKEFLPYLNLNGNHNPTASQPQIAPAPVAAQPAPKPIQEVKAVAPVIDKNDPKTQILITLAARFQNKIDNEESIRNIKNIANMNLMIKALLNGSKKEDILIFVCDEFSKYGEPVTDDQKKIIEEIISGVKGAKKPDAGTTK